MKPHKYLEVKQQKSLITRGSGGYEIRGKNGISIYNIRSYANALNNH